MLEVICWFGVKRNRVLLVRGRPRGPVFVTHRCPGLGKVVAPRDVCPDAGLARLLYGQAGSPLDQNTVAVGAAKTGWDLYEWRRSGLTRLGEAGASLLMLAAESRHRKPENVRRYFKSWCDVRVVGGREQRDGRAVRRSAT